MDYIHTLYISHADVKVKVVRRSTVTSRHSMTSSDVSSNQITE